MYMSTIKKGMEENCHKLPLVLSLFLGMKKTVMVITPATGCTPSFNNDNQSWSRQPESSHHDHIAVSVIEWFHFFYTDRIDIYVKTKIGAMHRNENVVAASKLPAVLAVYAAQGRRRGGGGGGGGGGYLL